MQAIQTYINEAFAELHQVRWPTRQQAVRLSAITLGFVLATAAAFGFVDYLLALAIKTLLSFT